MTRSEKADVVRLSCRAANKFEKSPVVENFAANTPDEILAMIYNQIKFEVENSRN